LSEIYKNTSSKIAFLGAKVISQNGIISLKDVSDLLGP